MSKKVAYFCMEYGLKNELKTYAGGLGILAGDILKAAGDSEVELTSVGILWSRGYGKQEIEDGEQVMEFPEQEYNFLEDTGVSAEVDLCGLSPKFKVYRFEVSKNSSLYLIDTDLEENTEKEKKLSRKLYNGSVKDSIRQQAFLGFTGGKLLDEIKFKPDIYHLNESDTAFVGLELLKEKLKDKSFEGALEDTKKEVRFTTHTPVGSGNPSYGRDSLKDAGVFQNFPEGALRKTGGEPFNLSLAALRMSGKANAVSKRHKIKAGKMWSEYEDAPKIIGISNGVHLPTWQSEKIRKSSSEEELWKAHQSEKERLLELCPKNFDPEKPLIGYARRFTDYKRPDLFFWDEERIEEILTKINVIFAGKAHPDDGRGKELLSKIVDYSKRYDPVGFIENYDMEKAKKMVRGCDIWLSCPVPPKEACSTSVMKAALNGVLNVSTLDGWWWEACENYMNGWEYGDGKVRENRKKQNEEDAKELYRVLEEEVIPTYEDEREKWVEMMSEARRTVEGRYTASWLLQKYRKYLWER